MSIFVSGNFTSHSGRELTWKIESDNFTQEDWELFARIAQPLVAPYKEVIGIPTGGWQLAKVLKPYCDPNSASTLIVDDVWTTGASMHEMKEQVMKEGAEYVRGFVVFDRGTDLTRPWWVDCLFKTSVRIIQ